MLTITDVQTFYGQIQALHGVSLEVPQGQIVSLIGANGAGKSTLLMTVCGNPVARQGSVVFEGRDITRLPTYEIIRMGIAHAPEGRRIFPRMSVFENLQMGAITADPGKFNDDLERIYTLFPILK
jgi:branched-chain amino acid transport system ATP-binding protein